MKRALLSTIIAVFVTQVSFGQKEVNKKFSGIKAIRMKTAQGNCRIQKSSDGSVTVNLKHTYDDTKFEPTIEQSGDRLEIRERYNGNNQSGNASWTLTIPDEVRLRVTSGSGDIEASGMKADMDVTTGSGDLLFSKITGEVKGNTGSGDLELTDFDGELNVNIGSGSARVENTKGDIRVNTGSGNVRIVNSNAEFDANTGSGDVSGRNIVLAGSSRFNSGSGDSDITLGAAPKFDIFVNSGSGNAALNFNGNQIAGEITMEANKRGGRITAPFEFDHVEEISNGGDQVIVKKTVVKNVTTPRIHVGTGSGEALIKQ